MTNPMFNPQPNYSGVTIQIANPTVNTNPPCPHQGCPQNNVGYVSCPQAYYYNPEGGVNGVNGVNGANGITAQTTSSYPNNALTDGQGQPQGTGFANAYPAQYYLNNYNYQGDNGFNSSGSNGGNKKETDSNSETVSVQSGYGQGYNENGTDNADNPNSVDDKDGSNAVLRHYDTGIENKENSDMSKSTSIIGDIDERDAQMKEEKKNTKEKRVVALTDEYIKSLENYLNNPNDEIRLMASKEILTRLDEDKDRYNDAALNALLNKMLQDPSKLVRIAALSAFGSQLACGNDYTVQLLQNIQSNPSADKEDVLQAADILLKMSAGTEVKNIPTPQNQINKK